MSQGTDGITIEAASSSQRLAARAGDQPRRSTFRAAWARLVATVSRRAESPSDALAAGRLGVRWCDATERQMVDGLIGVNRRSFRP